MLSIGTLHILTYRHQSRFDNKNVDPFPGDAFATVKSTDLQFNISRLDGFLSIFFRRFIKRKRDYNI